MTVSYCLAAAAARLASLPPEQRQAYIDQLPEACERVECTTGSGCRAYVDSVLGAAVEQHRRECEARHYLRQGIHTRSKVDALIKTIAARRGEREAEALRAAMREQWRARGAWHHGAAA